jgi:AcrR family transcriptional regulator
MDRRVFRTRNALYDALVSLILRQDFSTITVQDILEEADVGRSTFYSHFTSREDLLTRSLDRLRDLLLSAISQQQTDDRTASWSLVFFRHVGEYRQVYQAMAGIEAGEVLRSAVRRAIVVAARQALSAPREISDELATEHVASTFMTVVAWWLERRRELSPDDAERQFRLLMPERIKLL